MELYDISYMETISVWHEPYLITTDKTLLKPDQVHAWLSQESYWAKHIPYDVFRRSMEHSWCIGILKEEEQVGFARLITDYATFAYLADVYVTAAHRGMGLSKKMMQVIMDQPWVNNLRRIMLATLDAHELYRQYGFDSSRFPQRLMEITRPLIYEQQQQDA